MPIVRQRDFLDLVLADERLELAVGDRVARLELREERLRQREEQEEPEHVPDRTAGRGAGGVRRSLGAGSVDGRFR